MSEREEYEASKEARRTVLHGAGHEPASGDHTEALLRYLKGSARRQSPAPAEPLSDAEIRARAVDRVLDAGGEVTGAIVIAGSVWLRGRVGCRSEITLLRRALAEIPGVNQVVLRLEYDIDDVSENPGAEAGSA
jgi:hypothetical protein